MRHFSIIVATDSKSGIGKNGTIPWRVPADMHYFKSQTIGTSPHQNAVIMGRKTWESIGQPLKNRVNVVVSSVLQSQGDGFHVVSSLNEALSLCCSRDISRVYVIGGEQLYREALVHPLCDEISITHIEGDYDCDAWFPSFNSEEFRLERLDCSGLEISLYKRINKEEQQYLDLIERILSKGYNREDRTGTGTLSLFGEQMRFSLRDNRIPLLTTKRVFWKAVVEELLWFLRGSTDSKTLEKRGVNIWQKDSCRETLDRRGFSSLREGDIGPGYGFQWRHSGAEYVDCDTDYTDKGVDQIKEIIRLLKTRQDSRRIVLSSWNVRDIGKMALPPCHISAIFNVHDSKLSCMMTQRSGDVGLGVPFNIASYSLLTIMLAKVCDLEPFEFVHCIADTHIYKTHVSALKSQISRQPFMFPTLVLPKKDDIDSYTIDDLLLLDYKCHPAIKMDQAF